MERVNDVNAINNPLVTSHKDNDQQMSNNFDPSDENCKHSFQYYCGRYFDTIRGLNIHRRSCFITEQPNLRDMFVIKEALVDNDPPDTDNTTEEQLNKLTLLKGVKLPKNASEWECANDYFKLHLDYVTEITDVNLTITDFNELVYNYFSEKCGVINDTSVDNDLINKYRTHSKNKLKKTLNCLKGTTPRNLREIKFVSNLLRQKLKRSGTKNDFDHNANIKENKKLIALRFPRICLI